MPTINFLRERLGFNDDIIRRLCTFKDVFIKGNSILRSLTETLRPNVPSAPSRRTRTGSLISRLTGYHTLVGLGRR